MYGPEYGPEMGHGCSLGRDGPAPGARRDERPGCQGVSLAA